jgi:hypothetical protein
MAQDYRRGFLSPSPIRHMPKGSGFKFLKKIFEMMKKISKNS